MKLTTNEAARKAGTTPRALYKAIKRGILTAKKNHQGSWEIETTDLFKVYKPLVSGDSLWLREQIKILHAQTLNLKKQFSLYPNSKKENFNHTKERINDFQRLASMGGGRILTRRRGSK